MPSMLSWPPADRHSLTEDIIGVLVGTLIMALSVQVLLAGNLITGQIAGLSLIASYGSGLSFGVLFFVFNLPFYVLAYMRMGLRFVIKTFSAVALLSVQTELLPMVLRIETVHPLVSAVISGVLAGIGLIVLFRHGTTLGGVGIVALWLQDKRGIPAGAVQLAFDLCVFLLALVLFDWRTVVASLAGAVILNLMITVNHRGDRYIARS